MSGYKTRTLQHSLAWVNGHPRHNTVDNECVADFSCCCPELFTQDLEARMRSHALLIERLTDKEDN